MKVRSSSAGSSSPLQINRLLLLLFVFFILDFLRHGGAVASDDGCSVWEHLMIQCRRRKCRHCGQLYDPDPRNRYHQRYCRQADCRRASKAASQAHWLADSKNPDYFRSPIHVQRVRTWRKAHPGYWRKPHKRGGTLQDHSPAQVLVPPADKATLSNRTLQDVCRTQGLAIQGLVAQLADSTLQEDIATHLHRLILLGQQIQGPNSRRPVDGDHQTSALPPAITPSARPIQLDRPPAGPG